ncbi:UvrD-helicase domain-containing protein [bacterium]|nr:UvrD-helicase domain-containing protein [bacterium]
MTDPRTDPIAAATAIQRRAARPDRSVALRASAGSGKTKVLVDRFLRLCIEDGPGRVHPRSILAVTFTRKAAVEIEERLLGRARRLAVADEATLDAELADLFADRADPRPTPDERTAAANLLERILEDVSGLNVGTIHSFCQLILGRFAAEAGLDPHFTVLENPDELLDEALERLEAEIAADPDLARAAAGVAANPLGLRKALRGLVAEQMRLGRWVRGHAAPDAAWTAALPALLGDIRAFLFPDLAAEREPTTAAFLPGLAAALTDFAGPGGDAVAADMGPDGLAVVKEHNLVKLRDGAAAAAAGIERVAADPLADEGAVNAAVAAARAVFLTAEGRTRQFTAIRRDPAAKERFNVLVAEQALDVLARLHRLAYIELYRRNRDLLRLVLRLFDIAGELKRRDRVVDFQDLEDMACRLMGDAGRVGALLHRLDDSISHILLDEFQDTNFNQWDMLRPFVDEFLAGDPERPARTLFFVGDVKQSIYGFRGAEPDIFTGACRLLAERGQTTASLPTNFRSVGAVVGGVGLLFNRPPLADALPAPEREHVRQAWARPETPGPVHVLAPFVAATGEDDDGEPAAGAPDDDRSGDQLAARTAALLVRSLKEDPAAVTWDGFGAGRVERRLRWDDFLVLTRARTEISLYEHAFRAEGIPFVPPGRGMLAASREVQDVIALLRWLLWPEDDAALATVLRSPLLRLAETDLQRALAARDLFRAGDAPGRFRTPRGLWSALRDRAADPAFAPAVERLGSWRRHAGREAVHDLLRRIFREADALARYAAAGGEQARYNLLRLTDVALGPEVVGTPTVQRLVEVLEAAAGRGGQDEGALPRAGGDGRVRFLTIHGAKGLEAPVVLLVDADRPSGRESSRARLHPDSPDTPLLFGVTSAYRQGFVLPEAVRWPTDPLQDVATAARQRADAEDANLLYVALTRARDRLYVLGGANRRADNAGSPLRTMAEAAAAGACGDHVSTADPAGVTRPPAPTAASTATPGAGPSAAAAVRAWDPPTSRERLRLVTPSGLAPADEDDDTRLSAGTTGRDDELDPTERGERVHLLLQLAAEQGALPPGDTPHHAEARGVWDDPALAHLLRPGDAGGRGLCEVPVLARLEAGDDERPETRLTGVIDRLVVGPAGVDIVDYKTNRFGGDAEVKGNLVRHYTPQLRCYRDAVARLYPDRPVRTWLLFTEPGLAPADRLVEVVP